MPKFSSRSERHLKTCDERLQLIARKAIEVVDFTILCGHRDEKEQNHLYLSGASQLKYPYSFHNRVPAMAMDCAVYPVNWEDISSFYYLAGILKAIAHQEGVGLVWGGDWKTFKDYPHFQIKL